jgi:hypothetical protein
VFVVFGLLFAAAIISTLRGSTSVFLMAIGAAGMAGTAKTLFLKRRPELHLYDPPPESSEE